MPSLPGLGAVAGLLAGGGDSHTFPYAGGSYSWSRTVVTTASFQLRNYGDVFATNNAAASDQGDWISPKDSFSNYSVRATLTGGSLATGTTGSWLQLNSNHSWTVTDALVDGIPETASLDFEIRNDALGGIIVDTFSVDLEAERI